VDLDSFLVSLYVQLDDWWKANHPSATRRPGRPALLSDSEVLTLAILAQWPRFRSERDFWRFASSRLRPYFPSRIIEGVIGQLKDFFGLERHRAKTLGGLLTRVAAKGVAYTFAQRINDSLGRPLRHLADLIV
jgi:hypothetical protein